MPPSPSFLASRFRETTAPVLACARRAARAFTRGHRRFRAMIQKRRPRPLSLLFREKGAAPSIRGTFHRSKTNDHGILADCLRRSAPISRFCHRDSAPDATSPGAVSRFGLAPVHHAYENTRAASLGIDVVERLLQHDTKSGHTFESSSHLARVDRPKPGHAFLSTLRLLCSRRFIGRGCERHGLPLARKFSLSAMPLFRDSSEQRASLARGDVPAERTESEECRALSRRKGRRSSPSSTHLGHPWSSSRAPGAWRATIALRRPRLIRKRPIREERTLSGEPRCLPSSGPPSRRRSLLTPTMHRPLHS